MGRAEVRQRQRKGGEQAPVKATTDAKTIVPHQTEKLDKVEESKSQPLESHWKLTLQPSELPDSYGETKVVLLPVEPYLLNVYWDVFFTELEKAKHQLGDEYGRSQAILRCYDITNIISDGTNANSSFDVRIDLLAKNWYVHLWSPEKSYFVELGFNTEDGRFYPIARSNICETPRAWPAPKSDEHYMLVAGDYDLLETVPAPIDVPRSCRIRPRTTSQAGPELPSAIEADHRFEMQPTFAAEVNLSKTEVHEAPFAADRIDSRKVNMTNEKEGDLDLTEFSERRFTFGVSSRLSSYRL